MRTRQLAFLVASFLALLGAAAYAAGTRSEAQAVDSLVRTVWADHRIVLDTSCLGLDGNASSASRFACRMDVARRPTGVSAVEWDKAAAAIRSGNPKRITSALGVPQDATNAGIAAIVHRWGLDRPRPTLTGLRVTGSALTRIPSPLTKIGFANATKARADLRASIPAIEAYYSDNGTYSGMTITALRKIDSGISGKLTIGSATADSYCASVRVAASIWSYRGPGGPIAIGGCA